MKKIYLLLAFLISVFTFIGCETPEVELVEFNDSYALDKNIISVDMPKKFDYDPSNIVKVDGNIETRLIAEVQDGVSKISDKSITIRFRLRKAVDKELTLSLKEDREQLSKYPESQVGLLPFPEGALKEYEVTIPAGVVEHEATIELDDVSQFTDEAGYLTALSVSLVGGDEVVTLSKNNFVLFVKVEVPTLIVGDNVSYIPGQVTGDPVKNVVYSSNYESHRVQNLEKYNYNSVWWVEEGSDTYLQINFDMAVVLQGTFMCPLNPKQKTVKRVKIEVSNNGGETFVEQGYLDVPDARWYISFEFDTPQEINAIKFSEFETHSNDPSDMYVDFFNVSIFY